MQFALAVLCLEDKIVQQAVATVLEAIYEEDFLAFSYGFRPGRGQHDVLDILMSAFSIRVFQRRAYGLRDEEYLCLKVLTCMLPQL